jgi:ketosteroid isomerase-like protein
MQAEGLGERSILEAEERLRQAMLAADTGALEEMLSADLIFTSHMGQVLGKADDLAAHASGLFKIHALDPSERQIRLHADFAVVSVRMRIEGTFNGAPANGDFRFTRIWKPNAAGRLQVVAGHAGMLAGG